MRMQFLGSGAFWGILLVIFGLSMVLKSVFKVDIPVFKTLLAILLIYFGIRLLTDKSSKTFWHSPHIEHVDSNGNYDVIFGSNEIDLRNTILQEGSSSVNVDVIFGSSIIRIDPDIPARIKVSTVFAECKLPKGKVSAFGDYFYETSSYDPDQNALLIELDIVFGSASIIE